MQQQHGTSGSSGIAGYRFQLNNGTWTAWQTSTRYIFTGITGSLTGVSYTVNVQTKDNAGNVKLATGSTTVKTELIGSIATDSKWVGSGGNTYDCGWMRDIGACNFTPRYSDSSFIMCLTQAISSAHEGSYPAGADRLDFSWFTP